MKIDDIEDCFTNDFIADMPHNSDVRSIQVKFCGHVSTINYGHTLENYVSVYFQNFDSIHNFFILKKWKKKIFIKCGTHRMIFQS